MIWFIFVGLLLAATWSLQIFAQSISQFAGTRRARWAGQNPKTLWQMLWQGGWLSALEPSMNANRLQALAAHNLRSRSWRGNLIWACLSSKGLIWTLLIGALFLQVNASLVLAAGFVLILLPWRRWGCANPGTAVIGGGLFLLLGENSIRWLGSLGAELDPSLALWLADGRPLPILGMLVVALVISAVLRIEFLFFTFALWGLASGILSVNGAVVLWLGERAGLAFALWVRTRRLTSSTQRMGRGLAFSHLGGAFLAWVVIGFVRDLLGPVGGIGMEDLHARIQFFLLLSLIAEVAVAIVVMAWGHLAAKKAPDDLLEAAYFDESWLVGGALRASLLRPWLEHLRQRRAEITRLRVGFTDEEWKKVPPPVQQASERDGTALGEQARRIEAHLLSRPDFVVDLRG